MSLYCAVNIRTHRFPWRVWRSYEQVGKRWRSITWSAQRNTKQRRAFSTSREDEDFDTYEVPCGASGSISVNVYNSQELQRSTTPLVIYLPPQSTDAQQRGPQIPHSLRDLPFKAAFARINYRWHNPSSAVSKTLDDSPGPNVQPLSTPVGDQSYSFPTPVHDVTFGFDFLTAHLLPTFDTPVTSHPSPPSLPTKRLPRPLIVAGSFLGGTLATSLALTSTYARARNAKTYIAGLITQNAPFDWTSIAVSHHLDADQSQRSQEEIHEAMEEAANDNIALEKKGHEWTFQTLQRMRSRLFSNPGGAFDSFASPVLFFHTPGYVVPHTWPGSKTTPVLDRYSTSLDEDDDLVIEAPDLDIAGDGERGEAELTISAGTTKAKSKVTPTASAAQLPAKAEKEYSPEIARTSYLKFPPTVALTQSPYSRLSGSAPLQEQLKIPRSLFLYTAHGSTKKSNPKKKGKSLKAAMTDDHVTPEVQAREMARLMKRSVLMVESKDRTMWDDSFDAQTVAEERVKAFDIGDEETGEKIKDWLQDCID